MSVKHFAVFEHRASRLHASVIGTLIPVLSACCVESEPTVFADPAGDRFADEVYPILLRDCAMSQCHGSEQRFFRVVGPGRTRLSPATDVLAAATPQEILVSYDRARSMLEPPPHTQESLLLCKPLALDAGGATHGGNDAYGRNVYPGKLAPGYSVLAAWAEGTMANHEAAAP